jgi:thioredoxin 1
MSITTINEDNFEEEVLNSTSTVLLYFWAPWCTPCIKTQPVLEEIDSENEDIAIGRINIDEYPLLAVSFGISEIPSFVLLREGRKIAAASGAKQKNEILKLIGK